MEKLNKLKEERLAKLESLRQDYFARLKKEEDLLKENYNKELVQVLKKELDLEPNSYYVIWNKEVSEIGGMPLRENISFGKTGSFGYDVEGLPMMEIGETFGIEFKSSELLRKIDKKVPRWSPAYCSLANKRYSDSFERKKFGNTMIPIVAGTQRISEGVYYRMLEILNVDSGEGYMLMSEKYRKIKEELKALGLKVRVHLL